MEIHIEFFREIMKIRGISTARLASESGTPESTIKKLLHGDVEDPRISTLYSVAKYLGASIDRLVGLAPPRDFHEEDRAYDATLMETMQHRSQMLDEQLAKKDETIDALKQRIHECEMRISVQDERLETSAKSIAMRDELIKDQRRTIKYLGIAMAALTLVVVYFMWEFLNIDKGLTAMLYPDILK